MSMYPHQGAAMAPPQKPETFMLSNEAQQSLPQDAQVALQQVDNRKCLLALFEWTFWRYKAAYTSNSQIFPHLCSCGLDSRFFDQKISSTDWRIRFLRLMVSG